MRCGLLAAVLVVTLAGSVLAADPVPVTGALRLGPLPLPPTGEVDPRVHADRDVVPEIDPRGWLPATGDKLTTGQGTRTWTRVDADAGNVALDEAGVWWLAARLRADRWSEVTVDAGDEATVWIDGEKASEAVGFAAGAAFVLVRVEVPSEGTTVTLTATGDASLSWDLEPRLDFSRFDRGRRLARVGSLAVAPDGKLVARHLSRRNPDNESRRGEVSVLDDRGRLVASDLGGPKARPEAFTPDGSALLLRRPGEDGTDLIQWTVPRGPMRTLVTDEPDLGLVRFDPAGERLLLATTRGLEADDPATDQRRWDALRERVSDWHPRPHLQLVDLATGQRRVLTAPGDYTLDDAAWLPDGDRIVYARTLPRVERPWFATELRVLDLVSGDDRLVATFSGGWEVRPQALTPHPDGKRVAFIGPPEEVGGGRPEHNVYHKQVWLLDLTSGVFERISDVTFQSFAAGRGLPAWVDGGKDLLVAANAGSRNVLARLEQSRTRWETDELRLGGETGADWALSPNGEAVAYTASGPTTPGSLWLQPIDGRARQLEAPDGDFARIFDLSEVEDASFTGPGGDAIEAWWYRPTHPVAGKIPLIVYYYAGATPTLRQFNTTHQFWAAAGYAVLVVNPRGAHGYGLAFADWHAGDWGPAASADIVAATEFLLDRHPELDREHIGCYGGSYGGFMTMYLVGHSDLFAAACAMYGISDLTTYWGQGAWGWTYGDMAVGGRMPWQDAGYFIERSPLFAAGQVETPLLLLHGDSDTNVTPGESTEMFTALQVQGKPVEMVTFAGEGHGIAGKWGNYVAHRTMMCEWFDRWLKDQGEAWQARWDD